MPVTASTRARQVFRTRGGILRTTEAMSAGIHPRTLYALRDAGQVEMLARGVFRLAELSPLSDPDLATVAKRIPQGVVCLISALAFHELTTQIPHEVHLAVSRSSRRPILAYPPIRIYKFAPPAFQAGVEKHSIDQVTAKIYSAEKTLADCFKYRNKLGMEIVLESLRLYRSRKRPRLQQVFEFAKICRVDRIIRPYLEAVA